MLVGSAKGAARRRPSPWLSPAPSAASAASRCQPAEAPGHPCMHSCTSSPHLKCLMHQPLSSHAPHQLQCIAPPLSCATLPSCPPRPWTHLLSSTMRHTECIPTVFILGCTVNASERDRVRGTHKLSGHQAVVLQCMKNAMMYIMRSHHYTLLRASNDASRAGVWAGNAPANDREGIHAAAAT